MVINFTSRRSFLKYAVCITGAAPAALTQISPAWSKQIGLELYTVRNLLAKEFEGTVAKVAEIGYKEVEPVGYGGLDPKQFRALLDRYGLRAASTHAGATDGPDLEQQLAGHQIMGFKYTGIRGPRPATAAIKPAGNLPPGLPAGAAPPRPARTEESVKRSAQQYNKYGAIASKFGMKILIHNHATEFDLLENSTKTQYDVLLAETDPALVAMQLDIGWASIAGRNAVDLFRQNPGRYELWHVKDVKGLKEIDPATPPGRRRAEFVPIGQGEIDYKTVFAAAKIAGMKHFVIEQDNAGDNGADALAACRANYQGLMKVLS